MQATRIGAATAAGGRRRPRRRSQGEFLGAAADGREFWLLGGHVYCHSPDGPRPSHVCRLAAFNRLRKA